MKKLRGYFSILFVSMIVCNSIYSYITSHVLPHTSVAHIDISNKSKTSVEDALVSAVSMSIKIRIKNRIYQYRYSDLGIILNLQATTQMAFEPNTQTFAQNLSAFFRSLRSNTLLLPNLMFSQDYYHFARDSVYDFSTKTDEIEVDNTAKQLVYQENEEKYLIDPQSLKTQIVMNFGKETVLSPQLVRLRNKSIAKVLGVNTVLTNVFEKPVHIILQDYENSPRFTLPADQLKQLLTVQYDKNKNQIGVEIEREKLQTLISNIHDYLKLGPDKKIDEQNLKSGLTEIINSRSLGQMVDTLATRTRFTPNSAGTLAQKYIEVDISQQTMYLFDRGNLAHSYKISTGLYYPTPIGQFKIMNKATNAFSDIYNVWMPYWMAFYYSPDINAYFGIHELPYWLTSEGQKIQRPREFIGSPHTGGCVALDIGAAKEVYAFADINMPVYVYN